MREFTKSFLRFSWAMTVLGVRQTGRLMQGKKGRPAVALNEVSHTAESHLGRGLRPFYRAGEELQSGLVDAAADLASGKWSDPADGLSKGLRQSWEALDRSWSTLRKKD